MRYMLVILISHTILILYAIPFLILFSGNNVIESTYITHFA